MFAADINLISELRERADEVLLRDSKLADLLYKAAQRIVFLNRTVENTTEARKAPVVG